MAEQNKLNPSLSAERPLSEITDPNNDRFRVFQVRINFTLPKSTVDPLAQMVFDELRAFAENPDFKVKLEDDLRDWCADMGYSPNTPEWDGMDAIEIEVDTK